MPANPACAPKLSRGSVLNRALTARESCSPFVRMAFDQVNSTSLYTTELGRRKSVEEVLRQVQVAARLPQEERAQLSTRATRSECGLNCPFVGAVFGVDRETRCATAIRAQVDRYAI